MRRWLRDPLSHFLLAGAGLFLLYALVSDGGGAREDRIVVSEARVTSLAETFQRTWMRPPTREELRGLVDDYVMEEILYREALALGLDRDDLVVRRRMRQKMEFLSEVAVPEPGEADLAAHLEAHPERFALPPRTSFTQVFVDPERSDGAPEARAEALLAELRRDADGPAEAPPGDPTLLPRSFERATPNEVRNQFGQEFARALDSLSEGAWQGPVASAFGLHLVRISAREPGRVPRLEEVREVVAREWTARRRDEERARFQERVREGYEIVLPPVLGGDEPQQVSGR
jgi:hypothetical protein